MMRRNANEATVACPRMIRPGLTEIQCEADVRVSVGGSSREGTWVDDYDALCGHVLSDAEEGLVLDAAVEELDDHARAQLEGQADYAHDHEGRV